MYKKKLLKKITFWLSSNWNFIFCLFLLIELVESGVLRQPQTATKKNWAWKFLRFSFPPRRHLLIIFKLILGVAERKKNYLSTAHILSSRRSKKRLCVISFRFQSLKFILIFQTLQRRAGKVSRASETINFSRCVWSTCKNNLFEEIFDITNFLMLNKR